MDWDFIARIAEESYDIGKVKKIKKAGGDTNKSFIVISEKDGKEFRCCIRQYLFTKPETEIIREHAFMSFFREKAAGRLMSPTLIKTREGSTYFRLEHEGVENFYCAFEYMEGNEPFTWRLCDYITGRYFESGTAAAAKFHAWAEDFQVPEEALSGEVDIKEEMGTWMEEIRKTIDMLAEQPDRRLLYDLLCKHLDYIAQVAEETQKAYLEVEPNLPKCITHGDMLEQNMMFDDQGNVSAIFDFDWVTERVRLYDVAWMMHQSIATWDFERLGWMDPAKIETFFRTYNKTIVDEGARVGQLTDAECEFIPTMVKFLSIKVIMDIILYPALTPDYSATAAYLENWRYIQILQRCDEQAEEIIDIAKKARF